MATGGEKAGYGRHQLVGLGLGVVGAVLLVAFDQPSDLAPPARAAAAVGLLMAVWWMTEAAPLATTALLPLALFPVLGVGTFASTAASYAHPLIFLFLGGFLIARAMERWNLHTRIALQILRLGGQRPGAVIFSLMSATAFLSMWVSNTATAMMMLPIGRSVAGAIAPDGRSAGRADAANVSTCIMLGIGYAATIGGMGTLIGTPPNALFAGFMNETYGIRIGFAQWMLIGVPVVIVLLPVTWLILTRVAFRFALAGDLEHEVVVSERLSELGPMSRAEKLVAAVAVLAAAAWVLRPLVDRIAPNVALSDAGIAVTAAVLLFVLPVDLRHNRFLLSWSEAMTIRWDVLILFGGGLALAAAIDGTGLAAWIGAELSILQALPVVWLVVAVMIVVVYLGELASNTAMAAIFLPVAGAMAVGMELSPLTLTFPVALAASLGFMLPVATPPNAIVFGSGAVSAQQMLKAGALLDIAAIAIVALLGLTIGLPLLDAATNR